MGALSLPTGHSNTLMPTRFFPEYTNTAMCIFIGVHFPCVWIKQTEQTVLHDFCHAAEGRLYYITVDVVIQTALFCALYRVAVKHWKYKSHVLVKLTSITITIKDFFFLNSQKQRFVLKVL